MSDLIIKLNILNIILRQEILIYILWPVILVHNTADDKIFKLERFYLQPKCYKVLSDGLSDSTDFFRSC